MSELPKGWANCSIEDCADVLDSLRVPINNSERQQRIEGKSADQLFPYYGATGPVGVIDSFIFDEELVALGEDGVPFLDPMKPKAYMLHGKTWVNNHAHVLRGVNGIAINKFLFYYLNQFDYQGFVNGGTRLKLTQASMRAIPVTLPPLAEQTRIAQKLDELRAQVDTLKARLDAIPARLKRFRQSTLAAAVSGRLTADWRAQNKLIPIAALLAEIDAERQHLKTAKRLKQNFGKEKNIEGFYQKPHDSWEWVCFEQICKNNNNALKAGPFGSALKKSDCTESGYKIYGQEQVIAGDENLETYYIAESKYKELESCSIQSGDILVSLVGTIGKILVLSESAEAGIINPRLVKLSLNSAISSCYISYYLSSPITHDFFKGFSHGGTMEILNLGILKDLPIALPSIAEQTEIVRRVEQLFAFTDQLEAKIKTAQARVNQLTQSTLAKAFRGELVPQDPNDEPASQLLARIQAQRAAAPKTKRGKIGAN